MSDENKQHEKKPDRSELFTEKNVVGDDVDFFDLDAAKRRREQNSGKTADRSDMYYQRPRETPEAKRHIPEKKLRIPQRKIPNFNGAEKDNKHVRPLFGRKPDEADTKEKNREQTVVRQVIPEKKTAVPTPPAVKKQDTPADNGNSLRREKAPEVRPAAVRPRSDARPAEQTVRSTGPQKEIKAHRPEAFREQDNNTGIIPKKLKREQKNEDISEIIPARRMITKDDELFKQVYADQSFPVRRSPVVSQSRENGEIRQTPETKPAAEQRNAGVYPVTPQQIQKNSIDGIPQRAAQNRAIEPSAKAGENGIRRGNASGIAVPAAPVPVRVNAGQTIGANEKISGIKKFFRRKNNNNEHTPEQKKSAAELQIEEFDADHSNGEKEKMESGATGKNVTAFLVKLIVYIVAVLLVSVLLGSFLTGVIKDVFAFNKEKKDVDVIIPEYATLEDIAKELSDKGVIKYPRIFVLYMKLKGKDTGTYLSGTKTVSTGENYDMLLSNFKEKNVYDNPEIWVTIPEGYTVDDIIDLFVEKNGVGTREGFIDAIQNHDYDYWFVQDLKELNPDRKYRLEGYLYPDTYNVYKEWDEWKIIDKLLKNFYNKFSIEYKIRCEELNFSVDDVVNIGSLIQKEAKYTEDYNTVSAVLHNRLKSGRNLECNATLNYILPKDQRTDWFSDAQTKHESSYNSYSNAGLPPGPICNPSIVAVNSALYPSKKDADYLYFVSKKDGHLLFAKDKTTHEQNIQTVLNEK